MSLECKNCGAVYKGSISPFSRFVRCPYCNSVIVVPCAEGREATARKEFNIEEFKAFLVKRGINTFDTVSGILMFGNQEVTVNEDGTISGPKPLRSRVEKWVYKFMLQE